MLRASAVTLSAVILLMVGLWAYSKRQPSDAGGEPGPPAGTEVMAGVPSTIAAGRGPSRAGTVESWR